MSRILAARFLAAHLRRIKIRRTSHAQLDETRRQTCLDFREQLAFTVSIS